METTFWKNLILGRSYEEKVAQWFESLDFSVWRLGNFRLPIDLWVWNGVTEFSVEVKYRTRTAKDWVPRPDKLDNFYREELLKHFFFLFYPDGLSITITEKLPYSHLLMGRDGEIRFQALAWKRLQYFNITSQDMFNLYINKENGYEVLSCKE